MSSSAIWRSERRAVWPARNPIPAVEYRRLVADDKFEIHPLIKKELRPLEFDIPAAATADGELNLSWTQAPDSRGAGRGCQVAEVWLIKK
jgi:hypothetical protein